METNTKKLRIFLSSPMWRVVIDLLFIVSITRGRGDAYNFIQNLNDKVFGFAPEDRNSRVEKTEFPDGHTLIGIDLDELHVLQITQAVKNNLNEFDVLVKNLISEDLDPTDADIRRQFLKSTYVQLRKQYQEYVDQGKTESKPGITLAAFQSAISKKLEEER